MQVDRQTDRSDGPTHYSISHPSRGEVEIRESPAASVLVLTVFEKNIVSKIKV